MKPKVWLRNSHTFVHAHHVHTLLSSWAPLWLLHLHHHHSVQPKIRHYICLECNILYLFLAFTKDINWTQRSPVTFSFCIFLDERILAIRASYKKGGNFVPIFVRSTVAITTIIVRIMQNFGSNRPQYLGDAMDGQIAVPDPASLLMISPYLSLSHSPLHKRLRQT